MGFRGKKGEKKFVRTKLGGTIKKRKFAQKVARSQKPLSDEAVDDTPMAAEKEKQPQVKAKAPVEDYSDFDEAGYVNSMTEDVESDDDADTPPANIGDDDGEEGEGEEELDEVDEAEAAAAIEAKAEAKAVTKKMKKSIKGHKSALEGVKEKDPAFFEFLKQNDPDLLSFGDDMTDDDEEYEAAGEDEDEDKDEDEDEDESDSEEEEDLEGDMGEGILPIEDSTARILTASTFKHWSGAAAKNKTTSSLRRIVAAFRAACTTGGMEGDSAHGGLRIRDGAVFIAVVRFCMTQLPSLFDDMLGIDTSIAQCTLPLSANKWKTVQALAKQYITCLVGFMADSAASEVAMQRYTLQHAARMAPYIVCFNALAKKYVKTCVTLWASASDADVKIVAFVCMRRASLVRPFPLLEMSIKGMYLSFVRTTRTVTTHTMGLVKVMRNCIVELCGIDTTVSYQHAFVYLRQLAIHLRNAITAKTKEANQQVYGMQFLQSIEVWVQLVCTYKDDPQLAPLVYPLCQVLMGTARLMPTSRYFPLRLQCARMATLLCANTHTYIPVAPLLLQVLGSNELRKKPTGGRSSGVDLGVTYKASAALTRTKRYQAQLVSEVLFMVTDFLNVFAASPSFPELALPVIMVLRREAKDMPVVAFKKPMQSLADKLEQHSRWVTTRRSVANFGPTDGAAVKGFEAETKQALSSAPLPKHLAVIAKARARDTEQMLAERDNTDDGDDDDDEDADESDEEDSDTEEYSNMEGTENDDDGGIEVGDGKTKHKKTSDVPKERRKMLGALASELEADRTEIFSLNGF